MKRTFGYLAALTVPLLALGALSATPAAAGPYSESMEACRISLQQQFDPGEYRYRLERARKSGRLQTLELGLRPKNGSDARPYTAVCSTRSGSVINLTVTEG